MRLLRSSPITPLISKTLIDSNDIRLIVIMRGYICVNYPVYIQMQSMTDDVIP